MNDAHLEFCSSPEWRTMVEELVLPAALPDEGLGDDVIEIGPGPGFTTDVLRTRARRVTAVELDPVLAEALARRLARTNVEVVEGDATALDLPAGRFTGAASFNMLHHVPTSAAQDLVFGELARVLRPGGVLAVADALPRDGLDAFHEGDTYNPIEPDSLPDRLGRVGFVAVELRSYELGWVCAAHTT
ncbi:MAG TPA: class I SAM-dependent methyltransferase [Acidimicrobiia bacterium]|nr:class I SAM-dependent methyltransferase [Acidimicrobiia bacterium]